MAGVAFGGRHKVIAGFTSGIAAIVAGGARRSDATVIKLCR